MEINLPTGVEDSTFLSDLVKRSTTVVPPPQEEEALKGLALLKQYPTATKIFSQRPEGAEWTLKLLQRATHAEVKR